MFNTSQIKEHMEVIGSDGKHVGTVDSCQSDRIKLAKNDPASSGLHHFIDTDAVDRIEGNKVCLKLPASEAIRRWQPA